MQLVLGVQQLEVIADNAVRARAVPTLLEDHRQQHFALGDGETATEAHARAGAERLLLG
jgi:hypothetical protein